MRTLVAYFDISSLIDAELMKLHEEVLQLARAQPAGMFSPGRPEIAMKYGVSDRSIAEVIDRVHADEDAERG